MPELRLQIPDELVKKLQQRLGSEIRITDIARDALTLFNWAVEERAHGRQILSSDPEFEKMTRLAMASLENVQPAKPPAKADPASEPVPDKD